MFACDGAYTFECSAFVLPIVLYAVNGHILAVALSRRECCAPCEVTVGTYSLD